MFRLAFLLVLLAPSLPAAEPLRVAIAGLVHGHVGGFFNRSLARTDIRIVGIAEPDRALFDQYARRYHLDPSLYFASLDALLEKASPEAVLAYTSTFDHKAVVESCARKHVPVMMEKPLAVSNEHARAMARAAAAGSIPVLVNYETTWYASNALAYQELDVDKSLGDARKLVIHDGHKGPREIGVQPEFFGWLTDPERNGAGALFDFGCYGADLATWLLQGQRPLSVTAVAQQFKPDIYPHVDDEANLLVTYPKTVVIIQASWNWPFDRKDLEVYGATGSVRTVRQGQAWVRHANDKAETLINAKPLAAPFDDSLNYLRAVVRDHLEPKGLSALDTNMIVTEILDAARESARTGRTVLLNGR